MITIVSASNQLELEKRMNEVKRNHENLNPNSNVEVKVIGDKPEFNSYEAVSVTIGVSIINQDEIDK